MELNWTTFALEIVNFLILVWILKRFLYKPVLAAIARRKAAIDKTLSDAASRQKAAQALELQYQNRLTDWESEKEKLRTEVLVEIDGQRENMMAALQQSLAQEREKARVVEQRRLQDLEKRMAEEARTKGAQFTGRLLTRFASVELESKIAAAAVEDVALLPPTQVQAIITAVRGDGHPVQVISAFPLPDTERTMITHNLQALVRDQVAIEFREDSRLLAGLRINLGPWVLDANLGGELQFFANALRDDARHQ